MAKRFTDSEKWEDAWFQELESKHKLFWFYLLDKCDHAGVWKVNFRTASFFTDSNLEYEETIQVFKLRITEISNEYWLINKFIKYQYNKEIGELNVNNKVHLSVLNKLNNFIQFKPLVSTLLGTKDKNKAIDKDKDIVIHKEDSKIEDISKEVSIDTNTVGKFSDAFYRLWNSNTPSAPNKNEMGSSRDVKDNVGTIYTKIVEMKGKKTDKDVTPKEVYNMSVQLEHQNRFNFFSRVVDGLDSAFTSNTNRFGKELREHLGDSIRKEFETFKNKPY